MKKDISNEDLVHCLCDVASGQLPFRLKSSPGASVAPESFWLLNCPRRSLPSPHLQMLAQTLPVHRTRPIEGNSQQRSNYWINELRCDYKSIFLCHGNQQEGASATEYERLVSIGTSGLGDFFSPNRNMMLFSLNSMYVRHLSCILAIQIYYRASPQGGKINTLREDGVENTCTHTGHTYTSLDKKMDNN